MATELFIDIPKTIYQPGETLVGEVLWALENSPGKIQLSLGWWTEGRGNRDAKIEHEREWVTEEMAGNEKFEIVLPTSPYSFEGQLISLKWALELSTSRGKHQATADLVLTPGQAAVELPLVEHESKRKPFSFGRNR